MDNKDLLNELNLLKERISKIEKTLPSKNQLFGKPQSELGNIKSETVIATLGTLKVRYGNKYVTIFKDGKLTQQGAELNFIHKSDHVGTENGIYIVESPGGQFSVSLVLDGKSYDISVGDTTYVSFIDKQDTDSEQKETALSNIGLIYPSLTEFYQKGIRDGIVFITSEGKLYVVKNGVESEFTVKVPEEMDRLTVKEFTAGSLKLGNIIITNTGIEIGGHYRLGAAVFSSSSIESPSIICSNIQGKSFSIIENEGQSVLTIDKLIVRSPSAQTVPYYTSYNNLFNIEELDEEPGKYTVQFTLANTYASGDILLLNYLSETDFKKLYIEYDDQGNMIKDILEQGESYQEELDKYPWDIDGNLELITKDGEIIIIQKSSNPTEIPSYSVVEGVAHDFQEYLFRYLGNSTIECLSKLPQDLVDEPKLLQSSFVYLIRTSSEGKNIPVPLTSIRNTVEVFVVEINENIDGWTVAEKVPIITLQDTKESSGLLLHKPAGLTNVQFAKYSDDAESLPIDASDKTLATVEWVKQLSESAIPVGTIIAYHGEVIPKGWVLCNGENGTPNLLGKFIAAGEIESEDELISLYVSDIQPGATPTEVNFAPGFYSLIFIMKIK